MIDRRSFEADWCAECRHGMPLMRGIASCDIWLKDDPEEWIEESDGARCLAYQAQPLGVDTEVGAEPESRV